MDRNVVARAGQAHPPGLRAFRGRVEKRRPAADRRRPERLLPSEDRGPLFQELLALEIELRREHGDAPCRAELRPGSPTRKTTIDAAFPEAEPAFDASRRPRPGTPRRSTTTRTARPPTGIRPRRPARAAGRGTGRRLSPARGDRPGRNGHRLQGPATIAGAPGGPEDDPLGLHGKPRRAGAVPPRSPARRRPRPPQHRADLRGRRARRRPLSSA